MTSKFVTSSVHLYQIKLGTKLIQSLSSDKGVAFTGEGGGVIHKMTGQLFVPIRVQFQ